MRERDVDFNWIGSSESFVDQLDVKEVGQMTIGRFGGNSSAGQFKNEDACLVWSDSLREWEWVLLMDAHKTAESAEAVLAQVEKHKEKLMQFLCQPLSKNYFLDLEQSVLEMFRQEAFMEACRNVQGETACLIVVRKGKYVWWFSVGDCLVYLFHPELAALGQYGLNQRQFYEWIGQVNTFDQAIPCYSSGTRELRQGANRLLLATDGLVECPNGPYGDPDQIYQAMKEQNGMGRMLETIRKLEVRDSTTLISWEIRIAEQAAKASDQ